MGDRAVSPEVLGVLHGMAAMLISGAPATAAADQLQPVVGTPAELQLVEDSLSFCDDSFRY